jgi:hypothetical protein
MEEWAWLLGGSGSVSMVEMVEAENCVRCRERSVCGVVSVLPVAASEEKERGGTGS